MLELTLWSWSDVWVWWLKVLWLIVSAIVLWLPSWSWIFSLPVWQFRLTISSTNMLLQNYTRIWKMLRRIWTVTRSLLVTVLLTGKRRVWTHKASFTQVWMACLEYWFATEKVVLGLPLITLIRILVWRRMSTRRLFNTIGSLRVTS